MKPKPQPRGFVLIMVLVVIMLASMVAASLLFVLSAEHTASAASQGGEQSWATAMSGVYQAMRLAADPVSEQSDWQDNAASFRDQLVSDDGVQKWYFSVYSLPDSTGGALRFGLSDEASRINVARATAPMLEALPNLTPQLAQGLLGALSGAAPSSLTSANGEAPSGTSSLTNASNARWTCLDELLDVGGFTPALLYGSYSNLTGRALAQANPTDVSVLQDASASPAEVGLNQFLTVCSYDLNQDNNGQPRVNLNQADADVASVGLPQATVDYLKAFLESGAQLTNLTDLLWATNTFKDEKGKAVVMSSGITPAELPLLLDRCTITNDTRLVGLINLNTASAKVLAALPGMNDALAESIVAARVGLTPDARKTIAWLVKDGIVAGDIFQQVAPYLTTRSFQFHCFVAAYCIPAAHYRVLEAVVDVGSQPPAVLLLRDVSRLGLPFDPAVPSEPNSSGAAAGGAALSSLGPQHAPNPVAYAAWFGRRDMAQDNRAATIHWRFHREPSPIL